MLLLCIAVLVLAFYAACVVAILALRWINPPTTSVQLVPRFQAFYAHRPYTKRYTFVPLRSISPHLQHAVIAAEDARFYQHHGFDWGPAVYGAEAASGYWYHAPASSVTREQAVRLAAIIPAPTRRRPAVMNQYSTGIDVRMRQMGW